MNTSFYEPKPTFGMALKFWELFWKAHHFAIAQCLIYFLSGVSSGSLMVSCLPYCCYCSLSALCQLNYIFGVNILVSVANSQYTWYYKTLYLQLCIVFLRLLLFIAVLNILYSGFPDGLTVVSSFLKRASCESNDKNYKRGHLLSFISWVPWYFWSASW